MQIHHIKAVEEGGLTVEENLIVLCLKHHRMAHTKSDLSKKMTESHLREYKRRHLEWVASRARMISVRRMTPADPSQGYLAHLGLRPIENPGYAVVNDERGRGGQSNLPHLLGWHHGTVWRRPNGKSRITPSDELTIMKSVEFMRIHGDL